MKEDADFRPNFGTCKGYGCRRPQRTKILEALGQSSAESVALALRPGCALWTDDFAIAEVTRTECGVKRVWAQLVPRWAESRGQLDAWSAHEMTAHLVRLGYRFTSISAAEFVHAANAAGWVPSAAPLRHFIDYVALPATEPQGLVNIAFPT